MRGPPCASSHWKSRATNLLAGARRIPDGVPHCTIRPRRRTAIRFDDLQCVGGIARRVDHCPAPRHRVQVADERTPVSRVAEPQSRRQIIDQQQVLPVRVVGSRAVPAGVTHRAILGVDGEEHVVGFLGPTVGGLAVGAVQRHGRKRIAPDPDAAPSLRAPLGWECVVSHAEPPAADQARLPPALVSFRTEEHAALSVRAPAYVAEQRRLARVGGVNHCGNLSQADEEGEPVQDRSRRTAVSKGDRVEEDVHRASVGRLARLGATRPALHGWHASLPQACSWPTAVERGTTRAS